MTDPRLIRGAPLRNKIIDQIRSELAGLPPIGKLTSIAVGAVEEVKVYIRNQRRLAERLGIPFDEQYWPGDLPQAEAKARLVAMNDDPHITGIVLQRPIPAQLNPRTLQGAIHPLKDVEGMNPASIGNIVYGDHALLPCTAAASVELLKTTGLELQGLEVVMIGHSEIVGRPVALMLMAEGATVTVCHHMTRSVAAHSRRADALVVAAGKAGLIGGDMIKPGAAVIDVGINQTKDGIVGDVKLDEALDLASWITPVPGGVGPVTVAMLMKNALKAHRRQVDLGWTEGS